MRKDKPTFDYNQHTLTHIGGKKITHSTLTSDQPQIVATRKRDTGEIIVTTDQYIDYGMHHIYIGGEHIAGGYGFPTLDIRNDLCYIRETYNDVYEYFDNAYTYQTNWNRRTESYYNAAYNYLKNQITYNSYKNVKIDENKNKIAFGDISYTVVANEGTISILPDAVPYASFDYDTYFVAYYFDYNSYIDCYLPITYYKGYINNQAGEIIPEIIPNPSIQTIYGKNYYHITVNPSKPIEEYIFTYTYLGHTEAIDSTPSKIAWMYPICFGISNLEDTTIRTLYNSSSKILQSVNKISDITFELTVTAGNALYILLPSAVDTSLIKTYITENIDKEGTLEGGLDLSELTVVEEFPAEIIGFNKYKLLVSEIQNLDITVKTVIKLK